MPSGQFECRLHGFRALKKFGLIEKLKRLPPPPADWKVVRSIPAPEGSLVDLSFTLEDGPVEVVGKVIYTQGDDVVAGPGIGVEFMGLTRDLEERLASSIAERASRCLA